VLEVEQIPTTNHYSSFTNHFFRRVIEYGYKVMN